MSVSNLCCSICLDCFDCSSTSGEQANEFCVTSCGHLFHRNCITRWSLQQLNADNCCPICREIITLDAVKRVYPQFSIRSDANIMGDQLKMENIQLIRQFAACEQYLTLNKLRTVEYLRNLKRNLNAVDSNINAVADCMFDIETRILNAETILLATESTLKTSTFNQIQNKY